MITFVTSNEGKAKELGAILGGEFVRKNVELDEIQSTDVAEVAKDKAERAFAILKVPVIVDDSGVTFEDWDALPGALSKYFLRDLGLEKIVKMLGDNRDATAETAIAYCDENGARVTVGRVHGEISQNVRGAIRAGLGFSSIFVPDGGEGKTLAEMSGDEREKFSQRIMAAREMKKILEEAK